MAQAAEKLLELHEVGAIVLSCMDFRFRKQLPEAIFAALGIDDYDEIKLAGGAKNIASPNKPGRLETVLDDIRLALEKHRVRKIVLLNHQNCGKYGSEGYTFIDAESERMFHEKELRLAGDVAFSHFSDAEIITGYAWIDKDDTVKIDRIKASGAGGSR